MGVDLSKVICRLATLDEVVPLRHEVLRPGLPRDTAIFVGDHDATTKHFGAFLGAQIVCCASLMKSEWEGKPARQLRGMATAPGLTGAGLGATLLRTVDAYALANPPALLWCNARLSAVGFYKKQGWIVRSEEFMIEAVGPHHRMVKDPRQP
jgi:GNAT superfamily N-acetyltransferase